MEQMWFKSTNIEKKKERKENKLKNVKRKTFKIKDV